MVCIEKTPSDRIIAERSHLRSAVIWTEEGYPVTDFEDEGTSDLSAQAPQSDLGSAVTLNHKLPVQ